MKCIKCNHDIDETKKFCKYCGTPVEESKKYYSNNDNIGDIKNLNNQFEKDSNNYFENGGAQSNINNSYSNNDNNVNSYGNPNSNVNNGYGNPNNNVNNGYGNPNNNVNNGYASPNNNMNTGYGNSNNNVNTSYGNQNNNVNNSYENSNGNMNISYGNQNDSTSDQYSNLNADIDQNKSNILENDNNQTYDQNNLNNMYNNAYAKARNNSKKNKKLPLIIGGCVGGIIIILIIIAIAIKLLSGSTLNDKQIKESLYGQQIYIDGLDITLTEDNIESIDIVSRKTDKDKTDDVTAEIGITNGDFNITVEALISYDYYKQWKLSMIQAKSITDMSTDIDLEKKIREKLCEDDRIYLEPNSDSISSSLITDVYDAKLNLDTDEYDNAVQANIEFSNGVYSAKGTVKCSADYDWDKDDLEISYCKVELDGKSEKSDSVDDEKLSDAVKNYLMNTHMASYEKKFNIGTVQFSSSTYMMGDVVTKVEVNKYVLDETNNLIIAEVIGTLSKGIITEVNFEGNVSIPLDMTKDADDKAKLNVTTGKIETAPESDIQKLLIDARYEGKKLTMDEASSFKESNRNSDGVMCDIIHGTINVGGKDEEIQVQLVLDCDYDGNICWKVYDIDKKGSYEYAEF